MTRRTLSLTLLVVLLLAGLTGVWAAYAVQGPWLPHQLASYTVILLALWHMGLHRRRWARHG